MPGFLRHVMLGLILLSMLGVHPPVQAETRLPQSMEEVTLSFAPLVKKAAPAVVNIYTSKRVKLRGVESLLNDPFFEQFFGQNSPFSMGIPRERVVNSLGSGVIVRPDGLIISNNHVIGEGTDIKVVLYDRREFAAEVMLRDARSDLAIIKIITPPENPLPSLEFADSDEVEVGDLVLAIGNPFGVGQTVTSGIVSALARTNVEISDFQFFIQTDAAINPGNSGGALLDMHGKVIGINTAIFSKSGGSHGIGFATPSNLALSVINGATTSGRIVRPWLGTTTQDVTADIADSLGLDVPVGVLISEVYPGGAADKAGLKTGDVVTHIDGKEVPDGRSLRFRIATYAIDEKAELTVMRKGEQRKLSLKMEPPVEKPAREETKLEGEHPLQGAVVVNLSPAVADEMDIARYNGVIVNEVWGRSLAKRFGIGRGDIIEAINETPVESVSQLVKLLEDNNINRWNVTIKRGDQILRLAVQ